MRSYPLDSIIAPDITVDEYEEYKSFHYTKGHSDGLTAEVLSHDLGLIRKICGATYWKCVHVYIKGEDTITGEEYCMTNDTLDIPFKKVSIINVYDAFNIIFNTLLEMPSEETPYDYFDYWNSILIQYVKIVMKRFKPEKKYRRKGLSGKLKLDVMERDDYKCQICGATVEDGVKLHIDHIIPVIKGGADDIDNLQVLCHKCNLAKHDRIDLKCTQEKLGGLNGESGT